MRNQDQRWWQRGARLVPLAVAVAMASTGAHAYSVSFTPASQTVTQGGAVSVAVKIADVLPAGLGTYTLDVAFDSSILSFVGASDGFKLGNAIGLLVSPIAGGINLTDFSLDPALDLLAAQASELTVFTLLFSAVGIGSSPLTLSNVALGDADGAAVAFTQADGRVTVLPNLSVPTPGTPALLLAAGIAAGLCRRHGAAPAA